MKIEANKRYAITPKFKKSVEEIEFFSNEDDTKIISVCTLWRGGDYYITPVDEDEAEMLQEYFDEYSNDDNRFENTSMEITAFAEWELGSTWDGISVEYEFTGKYDWKEDEKEELTETLDENGYWDFCDENGFESTDCEIHIHQGVYIEEMKEGYIDG